jgi:mRNA interferase RelE/StbE
MSTRSEKHGRKRDITSEVLKFLRNLQAKHCKQVVLTILALGQDATPHDSAVLRDYHPYHRVDIGEYRVIYRFDTDTVYVAHVGKRNDADVYRWLKG